MLPTRRGRSPSFTTCKSCPRLSPLDEGRPASQPASQPWRHTTLTNPAPCLRLDYQDTTNVDEKGIAFTIRSVFFIDPKKTIRTILSYPASTGRNSAEILRVIDSLQTGDKNKITTPVNWVPGDDVIVHPSVKNEQAKELFPDFRIVKPYLRFTPLAKEKATAGI